MDRPLHHQCSSPAEEMIKFPLQRLFLWLCAVLCTVSSFAQTAINETDLFEECEGLITDTGGAANGYGEGETETITICPREKKQFGLNGRFSCSTPFRQSAFTMGTVRLGLCLPKEPMVSSMALFTWRPSPIHRLFDREFYQWRRKQCWRGFCLQRQLRPTLQHSYSCCECRQPFAISNLSWRGIQL